MSAQTNIVNDLNSVIRLYQQMSGQSSQDVLRKQGGKLGRQMYFNLRRIIPEKGSIRETALARLKAGKGINIRKSVDESVTAKYADQFKRGQAREEDKFWGESARGHMNWKFRLQQKKIQREIGLRESGRGIMSLSIRYPFVLSHDVKSISKYNQLLSKVGIVVNAQNQYAQFIWPGISAQSKDVVEGLRRSRVNKEVRAAIITTTEDILVYTRRKQAEIAVKAVKAMVGKQ